MENEIIWKGKPVQGFVFRNVDIGLLFIGILVSIFSYYFMIKENDSVFKNILGYILITIPFIRFFIDIYNRKTTTIILKKDKLELHYFNSIEIINFDYIKIEKHFFNIYSINFKEEKEYLKMPDKNDWRSGIDFFYDDNSIILKKEDALNLYNLIIELKNVNLKKPQ